MRVDDLIYFLAVAETGLMHKAALHCGVSQPALTKAVRRLEDALGAALFVRTPKGMQITPHGIIFRESAMKMEREYRNVIRLIDEEKTSINAKVRVGVTPANEIFVNDAFLSLLPHRPAIKLELKVALSEPLFGLLLQGSIDFALSPIPHSVSSELEVQPLLEETFYVISRKDHRLQKIGAAVKAEDLKGERWILPQTSIFARQQIDVIHRRAKIEGPIVQVENDYTSMIGPYTLIAQSDLLGIATPTGRALAENMGVRVLNLSGSQRYRRIGIFTVKDISLSPLTQAFIKELERAVSSRRISRN